MRVLFNCAQCAVPFETHDDPVEYNNKMYHVFCAEIAKHETDLEIAERNRKQKLMDENKEWLWDFMQDYTDFRRRIDSKTPDFRMY